MRATEVLGRQELHKKSVDKFSQARVQRQGFGLQDQEVARVRRGSKEAGPGLGSYLQNENKF